MTYRAPVDDLLFNMQHVAHLDDLATLPGLQDMGLDTAQAVLQECAKFNEAVIAPLNKVGDQQPSWFKDGQVSTTPGFKAAFEQFVQGGWQALQHPVQYGGQGLPKVIAAACTEILHSANMSFGLCPMLTDGAVEALLTAGSEAQKQLYIDKLLSGQWTGTMNLTEPQAGSDLAQVRTKAQRQSDGSYRLFGTKIFITYGDQDFTDNILHLVLARATDAPEGVKGISLFVVPKVLHDDAGQLTERNDVQTVSIEHKLGIKASPTAVLQFGDGAIAKPGSAAGAVGYLVGEENRGLEYMFVMMNAARFGVGLQGVAIAERAYQQAVTYAKDRVQSRPVDSSAKQAVAIIHHPDIRRMLMRMRALTQGCRALAMYAAAAHDAAHHHPDSATRAQKQAVYEFLVPLVKGYSTEVSQTVASLGVQIHGGMGFIEETGAAQYYRDSKILTIYEGTTAIQANDLVGRKTLRDGGVVANALCLEAIETAQQLQSSSVASHQAVGKGLHHAVQALQEVVAYVLEYAKPSPKAVFAGSVPYLMLAGNVMVAWQLARSLQAAQQCLDKGDSSAALQAKIQTATFYVQHVLIEAGSLRDAILHGADSLLALPVEQF